VALRYQSGEPILRGDHVTYAGRSSTVELVVVGPSGVGEEDWLFENNGAGVLVVELEPALFRRVYLRDPEEEEDLVFVARADAA
jgi:hypothetical protein